MKIMVLEDSPDRIARFQEALAGHEVTICQDVNVAKEFIKVNKVEYMFLDHDLGGLHHVESTEPNTGYAFVKFLVENKLAQDTSIVIHSMNYPGASNMFALLKRHGYKVQLIPYSKVIQESK